MNDSVKAFKKALRQLQMPTGTICSVILIIFIIKLGEIRCFFWSEQCCVAVAFRFRLTMQLLKHHVHYKPNLLSVEVFQ